MHAWKNMRKDLTIFLEDIHIAPGMLLEDFFVRLHQKSWMVQASPVLQNDWKSLCFLWRIKKAWIDLADLHLGVGKMRSCTKQCKDPLLNIWNKLPDCAISSTVAGTKALILLMFSMLFIFGTGTKNHLSNVRHSGLNLHTNMWICKALSSGFWLQLEVNFVFLSQLLEPMFHHKNVFQLHCERKIHSLDWFHFVSSFPMATVFIGVDD